MVHHKVPLFLHRFKKLIPLLIRWSVPEHSLFPSNEALYCCRAVLNNYYVYVLLVQKVSHRITQEVEGWPTDKTKPDGGLQQGGGV